MKKLSKVDMLLLNALRQATRNVEFKEADVAQSEEVLMYARSSLAAFTEEQWELAAELARRGIDETQYDHRGNPIASPSDEKDTP